MNQKANRILHLSRLGLPLTLAGLFLAATLAFFAAFSSARATPTSLRYVDGAGGTNSGDCTSPTAPCATVNYALDQATAGDQILVAQGTYTENLAITIPVTLKGGYEALSWTRDIAQYETILDGSKAPTIPGDWDGLQVSKASIHADGSAYEMWYNGLDLNNNLGVGYATSSDSVTWEKDIDNPVLTGTLGAWDEGGSEHSPFVLNEGGVYKMWYEGSQGGIRQLGYATSTNGIDWTKYGANPVLAAGPEGYDQQAAAHGSVLNDGGTYKLWYHAIGDEGAIVAYATSPDGVSWTKQGPVLHPEGGGWDEFGLWGPSVLKLNGTYWMWYSGAGPMGPPAIGVVTSTNGITWTRFLSSPVVNPGTPVGDPHVITATGVMTMYYTDWGDQSLKYATSTNGISWTIPASNTVLTPGSLVSTWGEPVVRFEGGSDGAVLDGFTLQNGSGEQAGGVYADATDILLRNVVIEENSAYGGPDSQGGAGVLGSSSGTLSILDSQIVNNQVVQGAGGIRLHDGYLVVSNTLVAGNRGDMGLHLNSAATLMNATVADNDGGVLINPGPGMTATLAITNSILYGNGWSLSAEGGGHAEVAYSDVEGGWTGTGNLDTDPWFVDPGNGDYHLLAGSPVIDAGTAAGAPDHDFEGDARPQFGGFDMGADEFSGFHVFLPVIERN